MLEIKNFNDFQNELKKNEANFPQLHYFEDDTQIILVFKSKERWEYYNKYLKSEMEAFAEITELTFEEVVEQFKINYCTNAINLWSWEKVNEIITSNPEGTYQEPIGVIEPGSNINKQSDDIDPGKDVIKESKDYNSLYKAIINNWEKKVKKSFESMKTLEQFKKSLKKIMSISLFVDNLPRVIKNSFKIGINAAEEDLNVQIGFSPRFERRVQSLTKQNLTGYMIDGKKWHGIKGTTDEQAQSIYDIVSEGVKNKESFTDIGKSINNEFNQIMPNQAEGIARTETTRFISDGKLSGYKESKVKGFKTWQSALLPTTGELDRRLHFKYHIKGIPFDDEFIDDKTGKTFQHPPTRTNCVCVLGFSFVKHPKH